MEEARIQEVDTYVYHIQNTVTQAIAIGPIMYLCLSEERLPWSRVSNWWWEQEGLDLEGMQTADQEAEREEGEEEMERAETDTNDQ